LRGNQKPSIRGAFGYGRQFHYPLSTAPLSGCKIGRETQIYTAKGKWNLLLTERLFSSKIVIEGNPFSLYIRRLLNFAEHGP
jgi:hypothetical protein